MHCDKSWVWNNSSTSNYLRHTISKHFDKLSPEERQGLESRASVNCSEDQELENCKSSSTEEYYKIHTKR